jgi:hypothetical protein
VPTVQRIRRGEKDLVERIAADRTAAADHLEAIRAARSQRVAGGRRPIRHRNHGVQARKCRRPSPTPHRHRRQDPHDPAEINNIISALGNIVDVLHNADPTDKAKIYSGVGPKLTYQPAENKVIAEATPPAIMYEGLCQVRRLSHLDRRTLGSSWRDPWRDPRPTAAVAARRSAVTSQSRVSG